MKAKAPTYLLTSDANINTVEHINKQGYDWTKLVELVTSYDDPQSFVKHLTEIYFSFSRAVIILKDDATISESECVYALDQLKGIINAFATMYDPDASTVVHLTDTQTGEQIPHNWSEFADFFKYCDSLQDVTQSLTQIHFRHSYLAIAFSDKLCINLDANFARNLWYLENVIDALNNMENTSES